MAAELDAVSFYDLRFPLINNWQAKEIRSAADARQGLIEQIPNPVRWTQTLQSLASKDVTEAIEVGPGNVLNGLLKSAPTIKGHRFGEGHDLAKLAHVTVGENFPHRVSVQVRN